MKSAVAVEHAAAVAVAAVAVAAVAVAAVAVRGWSMQPQWQLPQWRRNLDSGLTRGSDNVVLFVSRAPA